MLSALDLARRIEAGALTPRAAVELCADAIAAREAEIGAFAALDLEAARRAAGDPRLQTLPLRGLPAGIKDIFDTADLPTAYGSPIYAGHRPRSDAAMVMLLKRASGVVLGKTVTTEFASRQPAGTRNPHNLAHTPGVSSSGSAAAVAAGMLPLALGSQTGGSIIRPAAYCGVAGYKPSFRLLPTVGMKCFSWSLDTVGLFAAGVADAAFAAAALSGRDLRLDARPPAAPAIALVRTDHWQEASAAMHDAIERAARAAERSGAKIKELALPPIFAEAERAFRTIQGYEAFRTLAFEYDRHRDRLGSLLREQLDEAAAIDADAYDDARRTTRRARKALLDLLADGEAILTPSAPGAAPRAHVPAKACPGLDPGWEPVRRQEHAPLDNGLDAPGAPTFNRLWTLLGAPCVNVPGFIDAAGLPLGLQIVARFGRDRFALSAAAFLERAIAPAAGPAR